MASKKKIKKNTIKPNRKPKHLWGACKTTHVLASWIVVDWLSHPSNIICICYFGHHVWNYDARGNLILAIHHWWFWGPNWWGCGRGVHMLSCQITQPFSAQLFRWLHVKFFPMCSHVVQSSCFRPTIPQNNEVKICEVKVVNSTSGVMVVVKLWGCCQATLLRSHCCEFKTRSNVSNLTIHMCGGCQACLLWNSQWVQVLLETRLAKMCEDVVRFFFNYNLQVILPLQSQFQLVKYACGKFQCMWHEIFSHLYPHLKHPQHVASSSACGMNLGSRDGQGSLWPMQWDRWTHMYRKIRLGDKELHIRKRDWGMHIQGPHVCHHCNCWPPSFHIISQPCISSCGQNHNRLSAATPVVLHTGYGCCNSQFSHDCQAKFECLHSHMCYILCIYVHT